MRKFALILTVLLIIAAAVVLYPTYVPKPLKDGPGPLSVYISPIFAAPEYHSPLDFWQTHHMDSVNRGDFIQTDCQYCHEIDRSCNNCHAYVGAKEVLP